MADNNLQPEKQPTSTGFKNSGKVFDDLEQKLGEAEVAIGEESMESEKAQEDLMRELSSTERGAPIDAGLQAELDGGNNSASKPAVTNASISSTPPRAQPSGNEEKKEEEKGMSENEKSAIGGESRVDAPLPNNKSVAAPFVYRGPHAQVSSVSSPANSAPSQTPSTVAKGAPTKMAGNALSSARAALFGKGNEVKEGAVKKAGGETSLKTTLHAPIPISPLETKPLITPNERAEEKKVVAERAEEKVVREAITHPEKEAETLSVSASREAVTAQGIIRPIRTFRDDIARVLQRNKTSLTEAVAAEQDRAAHAEQVAGPIQKDPRSALPYILLFISALLITGGLSAFAFYYFYGPTDITRVAVADIPAYIFAEQQNEFVISPDDTKRDVTRKLTELKQSTNLNLGGIAQFYFTHDVFDETLAKNRKTLISAQEFLTLMNANAGSALVRTLLPGMTFGFHAFDGNQPFMIFKTTFYENAFAGMLEWEPFLSEDFAPLFGEVILESYEVGSSTRMRPAHLTFVDKVIKNKEVRVLYGPSDEELLLYGFPDENTLVITTNQYTFNEIVTRLQSIRI